MCRSAPWVRMVSALFVDYTSGCEIYDLFITYDSGLEVSDLFVGTCCRVWNLWFLCGYMTRLWGLESRISAPWSVWWYMSRGVRALHSFWHLKSLICLWLGVPSFEVWNLFVCVCLNVGISWCVCGWYLVVWDVWYIHWSVNQGVKSLTCSRVLSKPRWWVLLCLWV